MTINVRDANGVIQAIPTIADLIALMNPMAVEITGLREQEIGPGTTETLGGEDGAIGDRLYRLWIHPQGTSPEAVTYDDGTGSPREAWKGGEGSVLDEVPFPFDLLGVAATEGPWTVTTGSNVKVIAVFRPAPAE